MKSGESKDGDIDLWDYEGKNGDEGKESEAANPNLMRQLGAENQRLRAEVQHMKVQMSKVGGGSGSGGGGGYGGARRHARSSPSEEMENELLRMRSEVERQKRLIRNYRDRDFHYLQRKGDRARGGSRSQRSSSNSTASLGALGGSAFSSAASAAASSSGRRGIR